MGLGDIYQLRAFCSQGAQIGINDVKYVVTGEGGTGATTYEIAGALSFNVASQYKAVLTTTSRFRGTSAQKIFPPPRGLAWYYVVDAGDGTLSNVVLPPQLAALISFQSTKTTAGKGVRGRIFVPFINEDMIAAGGTMTSGGATLYGALGTAFLSTLVAGVSPDTSTLKPCLLDGTGTTWLIDSAVAQTTFSQQRRRSFWSSGDRFPL